MQLGAYCNGMPACKARLLQTLRIMKLTVFFSLVGLLHAHADIRAQGITLSGSNVPLQNFFRQIEQQSGYQFFYNDDLLKGTRKITVHLVNASLVQALDECFKEQPVSYEIIDKLIVVKRRKEPSPALPTAIDIKGKVTNEQGEAIAGATVTVKGTSRAVSTNENGEFMLFSVDDKAILLISSVSFEGAEIKVNRQQYITIKLKTKSNSLDSVLIAYNTGYEYIPRERATGSFGFVDNKLLNRTVTTNVLDRIENLVTGISFKNDQDGLLIRGRNSIFSNVSPLIVVDNFPYDGDISNINPNDVENITVLKDAAAASIWGARAGNGVIVITTKRGRSSIPQVSFNSAVTVFQRPTLYRMPIISSSDAIDVEQKLFEQGYYDYDLVNTISPGPLSPVVELLAQQKDGLITEQQATQQINQLRNNDVRDDLYKYFYRKSVLQQHSLNVSGNTPNINYYMSAGFDRNLNELVGNSLNRVTLRSRNTFKVTRNLQIDAGLNYVENNTNAGGNGGIYSINSGGGKGLAPYADLVDDDGSALVLVKDYRHGFADTVGSGKILDWKYRPLDEIRENETTSKIRDYVINVGISYKLFPSLLLEAKYQYENSVTTYQLLNSAESYTARDMINKFYQPDADNHFPVPKGGILYTNSQQSVSHQGRLQASYNKVINEKHEFNVVAGWEIKDYTTNINGYRMYGYNKTGNQVSSYIDYVTRYPQFNYGPLSQYFKSNILNIQQISGFVDRFISYYANASYSFDRKYTFSLSGRNDAANLFGVSTNQKGVGLWSAGVSWKINRESFYNLSWLPYLTLRATYGYSGNYSRRATAKTTAVFGTNELGLYSGTIKNPPNKNLRWEQDRIANIALDFSSKNGRVSGSLEYYHKYNKDLMARAPIDPTLGVIADQSSTFFGNVASIKGKGTEFTLNTINVNGSKWKWSSAFLFSYALTKIDKYLLPSTLYPEAVAGSSFNLIVGKPVFTMYSFPWAGLDSQTGDPLGYKGKEISNDYYSILAQTAIDSLLYNGPTQAPYFGAIRNTVSFANFSLSVNISFRCGYSFRSTSIQYSTLIGTWTGHSDYAKRWKNPGDEKITDVPSMPDNIVNYDGTRDRFYALSDALTEKGDQIRLEDIRLDYHILQKRWHKLPFQELTLYAFASDLGLLWTANKRGIDPYYPDGLRPGKRVALGINISF